MKKWISGLLVSIVGVMMLTVGVSAQDGLNSYEEALINKLSQSVVNAGGNTISIPASYVNQAKNYFISSDDMTKEQYAEIDALLDEGIALVKSQTTASISALPYSVKTSLLDTAKKMVSVIGMTLTYDGTNIVIVDPNGKVAFSNVPAVKVTGNVTASVWPAAVIGAGLIALMAGAMVVAHKKQLVPVK